MYDSWCKLVTEEGHMKWGNKDDYGTRDHEF